MDFSKWHSCFGPNKFFKNSFLNVKSSSSSRKIGLKISTKSKNRFATTCLNGISNNMTCKYTFALSCLKILYTTSSKAKIRIGQTFTAPKIVMVSFAKIAHINIFFDLQVGDGCTGVHCCQSFLFKNFGSIFQSFRSQSTFEYCINENIRLSHYLQIMCTFCSYCVLCVYQK